MVLETPPLVNAPQPPDLRQGAEVGLTQAGDVSPAARGRHDALGAAPRDIIVHLSTCEQEKQASGDENRVSVMTCELLLCFRAYRERHHINASRYCFRPRPLRQDKLGRLDYMRSKNKRLIQGSIFNQKVTFFPKQTNERFKVELSWNYSGIILI